MGEAQEEEEQNTRTDKTHKYITTECGGRGAIHYSLLLRNLRLFGFAVNAWLGWSPSAQLRFHTHRIRRQLHLIYTDVWEKSDTIVG